MSNPLRKFAELKEKAEAAQQAADKAAGALGEVKERMKKDFGCSTIKEAKAKLVVMQQKQEAVMAKFEDAMKQFEKDWGERVEEDDDNDE